MLCTLLGYWSLEINYKMSISILYEICSLTEVARELIILSLLYQVFRFIGPEGRRIENKTEQAYKSQHDHTEAEPMRAKCIIVLYHCR